MHKCWICDKQENTEEILFSGGISYKGGFKFLYRDLIGYICKRGIGEQCRVSIQCSENKIYYLNRPDGKIVILRTPGNFSKIKFGDILNLKDIV